MPTVFRCMLDDEGYRHWTQPFAERSHFVGRWQAGEQIRFMSPSGDGMLSEIAELRPDELVSIRHLGTRAWWTPKARRCVPGAK